MTIGNMICEKFGINNDAIEYLLKIKNKENISIFDRLIFYYFIDNKDRKFCTNKENELKMFRKSIIKDFF